MERRIKLTMAAIALGLLVAGGVRRWAKERGLDLLSDPQETAVAPTNEVIGFDAQTAAWSGVEPSSISPTAAQFPILPERQPAISSAPDLPASQPPFVPPNPEYATPETPRYNDPSPTHSPIPAAPPTTPAGFYVIQPNDSFWTISQRVYGTGRYFQALYEHNRRLCPQPDRLSSGVTIETPEPYLLERAYPDLFR
jgi:nucleoid-associated protein YgaU